MDKFEVRREWHYTIVENHVLKANLSPNAKLLYVILCMYANRDKECFPSYETLLNDTGIKSRATLSNAIKELKDIGILEVINRQKENASNIYIIKDNLVQYINEASLTNELALVQKLNKASSKIEHELKPYNYNQKELNSSCSSNSSDMGEIYKYYEQAGFGVINGKVAEFLDAMVEMYSKEWVMKAIDQAVKNAKYNLKYVEGILMNWKRDGGIKERGEKKNGLRNGSKEDTGGVKLKIPVREYQDYTEDELRKAGLI